MPAAAYQEMVDYITKAAIARGIDPAVAVRVAQTEALNVFDPSKPDMGGDDHSSFGLYQLHYGGLSKAMPNPGLGDEFTRVTGLDARDPSTWKQQVDFSLDHASKNGWGAWMGAANNGIGNYEGIKGTRRVSGPVEAAGGGGGADTGAAILYTPPSASAVSTSYNRSKEPPPEAAPYEDLSSSMLADDLASSVSPLGNGRQSSEGGNSAMYGGAASSPTQDYGSQPAPEAGQAPSALLSPSSDQPLADLFKVKDIGQAALADPRTGASLLGRQRRAYG